MADIFLEPHDGNFGISSWVSCACCIHDQGQAGWFAIRSGEQHWIDRARYAHYHSECGRSMIEIGKARSGTTPTTAVDASSQ